MYNENFRVNQHIKERFPSFGGVRGGYSLFKDPTGLACAAWRLCQYTETKEINKQNPPAAINIHGLRLIR